MSGHRAARFKFGSCEEITDLLERSAVLEGETHQAGDYVVQTDQFGGAVGSVHPKKDFRRMFVVVDAHIAVWIIANNITSYQVIKLTD